MLLNVNLNGIGNNEQRPVAGRATLTYQHPYTGEHDCAISTFRRLPASRRWPAIATDKPSYAPNTPSRSPKSSRTSARPRSASRNDVIIRDANGTTVATVATNDVVDGLPADPFPAWNYAIPVTAPVTRAAM